MQSSNRGKKALWRQLRECRVVQKHRPKGYVPGTDNLSTQSAVCQYYGAAKAQTQDLQFYH
jgi:hypothetical protein